MLTVVYVTILVRLVAPNASQIFLFRMCTCCMGLDDLD